MFQWYGILVVIKPSRRHNETLRYQLLRIAGEFIYMYNVEVYVVGLCLCFRRYDSVHLPSQSAVKSEKMNVDELFWNISSV